MARPKVPKVTIIGAGATGGQMAQLIVQNCLADVALVDLLPGVARGKALDIGQMAALCGKDVRVTGTGLDEWGPTEGSDIIINTAGAPRKPGQTREELAAFTVEVLKRTVRRAAERSPGAVYIGFTNPMDAATQIAMEISGFPPDRVVGQGGLLDTARFRYFLSQEIPDVAMDDIDVMVLGGHTEKDMVPIASRASVLVTTGNEEAHFATLESLLPPERIAEIVAKTRNGGKEIVELMGTSAAFAPAAATLRMVESILEDAAWTCPCSVYWPKKSAFVGLPTILCRDGVRINEEKLASVSPLEYAAIEAAADSTRALVEEMRKHL